MPKIEQFKCGIIYFGWFDSGWYYRPTNLVSI